MTDPAKPGSDRTTYVLVGRPSMEGVLMACLPPDILGVVVDIVNPPPAEELLTADLLEDEPHCVVVESK